MRSLVRSRACDPGRALTALPVRSRCSYAPRNGYNILSSKRGNKNHYKGKGANSTGHHTRKGGYRLLAWKLPDYVVPDLAGFEVRPSRARRPGRRGAALPPRVWGAHAQGLRAPC